MAINTEPGLAPDGLDLLADLRDGKRRLRLVETALQHLQRRPVVDLHAVADHRRLLGAEMAGCWAITHRIFAHIGSRPR